MLHGVGNKLLCKNLSIFFVVSSDSRVNNAGTMDTVVCTVY